MPRVILRTVEPAKLFACQSVEKRWISSNASRAMSLITRSVNGTIAQRPKCRHAICTRPSAMMRAERPRGGGLRRLEVGRAERDGVDQPACEQRHEQVGDGRADHRQRQARAEPGLVAPVAEDERQHHADRGATIFAFLDHDMFRLRKTQTGSIRLRRHGHTSPAAPKNSDFEEGRGVRPDRYEPKRLGGEDAAIPETGRAREERQANTSKSCMPSRGS